MASQPSRTYQSASGSLHRHTNSSSSVRSSISGKGSERRSGRSGVESAVTRLLIAIRQLLESLTLWSNESVNEIQVSDVYVRLGNDFNSAVAAFGNYNIDMSDLMSVPTDLRNVLESCLAEDATPANLEIYLPQVRQIITNLLQGLRVKQTQYRRATDRGISRREDSNRDSQSSDDPRLTSPTTRSTNIGLLESTREEMEPFQQETSQGSARMSVPHRENSLRSAVWDPDTSVEVRASGSRSSSGRRRNGIVPQISKSPESSSALNGEDALLHDKTAPFKRDSPGPVPSAYTHNRPTVPPEIARFTLTDGPSPISSSHSPPPAPPSLVVESASEGSTVKPIDDSTPEVSVIAQNQNLAAPDSPQPPEVASSLIALKKSETLERRASKRFSTYNFQKMTGSRPGQINSGLRRSVIAPSLTPGDLGTLPEEDESSAKVLRKPSRGKSVERRPRVPSPVLEDAPPPVPPVPSFDSTAPEGTASDIDGLPNTNEAVILAERAELATSSINVFLQVAREVKKVAIDPGFSLMTLRILFMDKFAYNPGQDNFPAIYIRDPSSGVQYELEDMDEVKERCLLSLNIEPLDQIKQHIDIQMANLARDLKEVKQTIAASYRTSIHLSAPAVPQSPISPMATPARPTDKQLRDAARRISRIQSDDTVTVQTQLLGLQPQTTGASISTISDAGSSRIVSDLRVQFDEVQNLRRDLGVMRQLYSEFMGQTKDSFGGLRKQTQILRQTAETKVGGARAFINSGKATLDTRSQNILTKVEELQDTVENLKDDVLKRQVTPRRHVLNNLKEDITSTSAELENLRGQIKSLKPAWKRTWEEELQNIVEEQQFLQHQEEFIEDLVEDHKALGEVYSHLEKVVTLRGNGSGRSRSFRPPPPEEGHEGISTVMLQIRGAATDPEKRLKAIEANQKQREKEKAGRSNEFEAELAGFVKSKKLKMTGGAGEAERIRQKKSEATLKAMFTDEQAPPVPQLPVQSKATS